MNMGQKIKSVRKMRKLTQKELGLAVGFPLKSADVRIAQYEMGVRVPKEVMILKIAIALKIRPDYLTAPAFLDKDNIIYYLFTLDDFNMIDINTLGENADKDSVQISVKGMGDSLDNWREMKKLLDLGEISEEEYFDWKYGFDYTEDGENQPSD